MEPERLQEITEPLETMLLEHQFRHIGMPQVNDSCISAEYIRTDGKRVDYFLNVTNDQMKDWGGDWAEYRFKAILHSRGKSIPLCDQTIRTNISTTSAVRDTVENIVGPKLEKYI